MVSLQGVRCTCVAAHAQMLVQALTPLTAACGGLCSDTCISNQNSLCHWDEIHAGICVYRQPGSLVSMSMQAYLNVECASHMCDLLAVLC